MFPHPGFRGTVNGSMAVVAVGVWCVCAPVVRGEIPRESNSPQARSAAESTAASPAEVRLELDRLRRLTAGTTARSSTRGNPPTALSGGLAPHGSANVAIDGDVIVVDYRNDPMSLARARGELVGPLPMHRAGDGVAGSGCSFDIECDDGNPCTLDHCTHVAGEPAGSGTCEHIPVADGQPGGCDDGLFCNGPEVCLAGVCTPGDAVVCDSGETCHEYIDACAPTCATGADCEDGDTCSDLVCVDGACVPNPANFGNPCGPLADCSVTTCNNGFACTDKKGCPFNQTCEDRGVAGCYLGRCCITSDGGLTFTCEKRRRADCVGDWFSGDDGRVGTSFVCQPNGEGCPAYGAGIAPHGEFVRAVGPVSISPAEVEPLATPLNRLGDDYELNVDSPLAMEFFRFVGGMPVHGHVVFEFYDHQGIFVEDVVFMLFDDHLARRTLRFIPPLTIPARGFVVAATAANLSPESRFVWASTTDPADVGTNDPNVLWINGARDTNGLPLTGNPLAPDPGVLAFEIVGNPVALPEGACCDTATGACAETVRWHCPGGSLGAFQGEGTYCASCSNDSLSSGQPCRTCDGSGGAPAGTPCTGDADCAGGSCVANDALCRFCDADSLNAGAPCDDGGDCDGGDCVGSCVDQAPCLSGACCDAESGACEPATAATCISPNTFRGFGTDCEPNCCPLSEAFYTGADDCATAQPHVVVLPTTSEVPVVINITGNNTGASSTTDNPDSCFPPGTTITADVGWWEAVEILDNPAGDDCFYLRVDHCCSSPRWAPVHNMIFNACPCGLPTFPLPNPHYPGVGASGSGLPFCDDDNHWAQFGPLRSGTWYIPVYSALVGTHGTYQLHVTVETCPKAACCVGDDCALLNQFQCADAGGYFLSPPNLAEAVADCSASTCATGSCCTGPGACVDHDGQGGDMDTTFCHDTVGGTFVGGVKCFGGTCGNNPAQGCETNAQCPGGTCTGTALAKAQRPACPICEVEVPAACQPFLDGFGFAASDRSAPGGLAYLVADDFRPLADTVSTVCVWGNYLKSNWEGVNPRLDCGEEVLEDLFHVRVYADDNLHPGALIGESSATTVRTIYKPGESQVCLTFGNRCVETYGFQLTLDSDIVLPVADGFTTYWLEVSNDTAPLTDCVWVWHTLGWNSELENGFGMVGASGMFYHKTSDQSFCLGGPDGSPVPFVTPPSPQRACCSCDGVCTVTGARECNALNHTWHIDEPTCADFTCPVGGPDNDYCAEYIQDVMELGNPMIGTVSIPLNVNCASTDGYNPVITDAIPHIFGHDLWYSLTPDRPCTLTVSTCGTGSEYPSMVGLYTAGPGEPCICPYTSQAQWDYFIGFAERNCVGTLLGFGGHYTATAEAGACYMIRVGSDGLWDSRGVGVLDVTCLPVPDPVLPDPDGPAGALACDGGANYGLPCKTCNGGGRDGLPCITNGDCPGGGTCAANHTLCPGGSCAGPMAHLKNRFIGFMAPESSAGLETAIRLRLVDIDGHPNCNNSFRWAAPPQTFDEGTPGSPTFKASALETGAAPSAWRDWTADGLVWLYGEEIIPGSTYEVQIIERACENSLNDPNCYSQSLVVQTARWGDVATPAHPFTPAAQPDVSDVSALVSKFSGATGAIVKARAKLVPRAINPAQLVDIGDISACVAAFQGSAYSFPISSCP